MRTRDFSFGVAVDDHALPEELRAILERWVDEVSADSNVVPANAGTIVRTALTGTPPSPKTSRARASRHGRSGTRREFSTRTFWWNAFAASSRSRRRRDCLRDFVGGRWSRRLKFRLLNRTTATRGARVTTAPHGSRRRRTRAARGGDWGGATATRDSRNSTPILTYVRTHV